VRVHGDPAVGTDQQVLAVRDGLSDDLAGEIDGRVPGHTEVTAGQHLPREGIMQPLGGIPYGVAFWHCSSLPGHPVKGRPSGAGVSSACLR